MPVDFFHRASGNARTCGGSSRAIGALLTCWWIVPLENPFNDKIHMLRAASVAQEEGLLPITDENETVVGNKRSGFRGHLADAPDAVAELAPKIPDITPMPPRGS